jgi:glucose/arabinose dehydrogenase
MVLRWFRSWLTARRRPRRRVAPALERLEERSQPAAVLPAGFTDSTLVAGLAGPTSMTFSPDGRLFVAEKGGSLRVVDQGVLQPAPFLTVPVNTRNERGLDGVVLDPNFGQNGFVYVYYTRQEGRAVFNRLSRFTADPNNPDVALPGSEVVLLNRIPTLSDHHVGGSLHFGPDGKLYLGVGDGGTGGGPAQSLGSPLGKILRIDPDGPSLIPADNPFVHSRGAYKAIWALGFRNPFTSAFDPATGHFFVNDVGEGTWEEINRVRRGRNYGWPLEEGAGHRPGLTDPVFQYHHFVVHGDDDTAITGGVFYRALQFPAPFQGKYFFADFEKDFIRLIDPGRPRPAFHFAAGAPSPVDLDVGPDGRLYYASIGTGAVHVIGFGG